MYLNNFSIKLKMLWRGTLLAISTWTCIQETASSGTLQCSPSNLAGEELEARRGNPQPVQWWQISASPQPTNQLCLTTTRLRPFSTNSVTSCTTCALSRKHHSSHSSGKVIDLIFFLVGVKKDAKFSCFNLRHLSEYLSRCKGLFEPTWRPSSSWNMDFFFEIAFIDAHHQMSEYSFLVTRFYDKLWSWLHLFHQGLSEILWRPRARCWRTGAGRRSH